MHQIAFSGQALPESHREGKLAAILQDGSKERGRDGMEKGQGVSERWK